MIAIPEYDGNNHDHDTKVPANLEEYEYQFDAMRDYVKELELHYVTMGAKYFPVCREDIDPAYLMKWHIDTPQAELRKNRKRQGE